MSLRNDKRSSNFGRMGQMLMTDGNSFPSHPHSQPMFEEDKPKMMTRDLSKGLNKTTNARPFNLSKGPDYMPSTVNQMNKNAHFRINSNNLPENANVNYYNSNINSGSQVDLDDDSQSQKYKPFRIKDMNNKNIEYMNNTGISTTTSSNTNKTMPPTLCSTSRREFNNDGRN